MEKEGLPKLDVEEPLDDGGGGVEGGSDEETQGVEASNPVASETEEAEVQHTDTSDDPVIQESSAAEEGELPDDSSKVLEEDGVTTNSELEETPTGKEGDDGEEEEHDVVEVEGQQQQEEEMDVDEQVEEEEEEESTELVQEETEEGTVAEDEEVEEEEEEEAHDDLENSGEGEDAPTVASTPGVMTRKRTISHSSADDEPRRKVGRSAPAAAGGQSDSSSKHDKYCWVCHKEGIQVNCKLCPRSYHAKCMSMDYPNHPNAKISQGDSTCPCPECVVVMNAETVEHRSDAMKQISIEQLMSLLKNICLRMRQTPGSDPFVQPVDPNEAEDYFDYIIYPMDIETLEKNIKKRQYGSTEAFLADAQWLVHNSIVFNSASSQYTVAAKRLLKVCKQELAEIETCPECYTNAHEKPEHWFVEACKRPHILVWAKLKGFPFWPAKAMKIKENDVDVRFFGQHDRAWVSMKDCFLYSEEMPVAPPKKNSPLLTAIEELTAHVDKLKELHGPIQFATVKTPIGPQLSVEQIRRMLPEYNPPEQPNQKSSNQSASKPNNNNNTKAPAAKGKVTRLTRKSSALSTSNVSESEASAEEQVEAKQEEEEKVAETASDSSKNVPEKKETEEDTAASVPKGSEILANALGVRRSTRGSSRSSESTTSNTATAVAVASNPTESPNSAATTLEKRLTRGSLKTADTLNDSGNDGETASDEQPPDSVLEAMGLSKKTKESQAGPNRQVVIKGEPPEIINDDDEDMEDAAAIAARANNKSTHSLVEQISAHTNVKPGYRFNLSKDISISAVDGGDHDEHETMGGGGTGQNNSSGAFGMNNMRPRRLMPTTAPSGRGVPQGIPLAGVGVGATRPRVALNPAGNVNGGPGQQRTFTGQQLRQMVRNARPQQILNPRTGVRITAGNATRPVTMMSVRGQQQQNVQKSGKDHQVVVDSSSLRIEGQTVNQVQGPITLPGGTITVTPLTSIIAGVPITTYGSGGDGVNGAQSGQVAVALKTTSSSLANNIGIINVQQQQSGGTTIVNNAVTSGGKTVKTIQPAITSAQQRRNLMVSIPPSVNMHLQNLTKTMGDLVKSTVEQIALEIVEFCNSTQGKAESSRLQLEVDRLQTKLKQEVTDVKHNNDIAMRELRMTMENDKKRAMAEMKRQLELEKQKAVEETKKKQWCANCGREALFYCCWNTSYCGYPCQEEHWPTHMTSCSQSSANSR
ncbi:Protein kinase C-binding protein 1 [Orchesella cincta]|uniref:Protein kinase C-binding protein 1 n=1 Tax=Orchesella cincta TaxID=48709 RepID=A0A1D2NIN9_ORCCI|nr:Protein kinase C-binding protein 1 [Orchesella cincta]